MATTIPTLPSEGQGTVELDAQLWARAVNLVSAIAHHKMPDDEMQGRISRATALAMQRATMRYQGEGVWHVPGGKQGYLVDTKLCQCDDFVMKQAPQGLCKHILSVMIVRKASKLRPADLDKTLKQMLAEEEEGTETADAPHTEAPPEAQEEEPSPPPAIEDACPRADAREDHERGERCQAQSRAVSQDVCAPSIGQPVAQDGIERSAEIGLLMGALARAQARMHNPTFDSTNPHFRNKYASLAEVRDAVTPALSAEGIAVTQLPSSGSTWVSVTTGLWHTSGQYLCSTLRLPVPKTDPQGYGSALTYARRYALQAVCNVAGEDDDDAERASGVESPGKC